MKNGKKKLMEGIEDFKFMDHKKNHFEEVCRQFDER